MRAQFLRDSADIRDTIDSELRKMLGLAPAVAASGNDRG